MVELGHMPEQFVSESIKPVTETANTSRMALGEPGLPSEFVWRGRTVTVRKLLQFWRQTGKCRYGIPQMYVSR